MRQPEKIPFWLLIVLLIAVGTNLLAGVVVSVTIDLMHGLSAFAIMVRAHDLAIVPYYRFAAFTLGIGVGLAYLWPIVAYFRCSAGDEVPLVVQRRVTSAPMFIAAMGFAPWLVSMCLFPLLTLLRYGHWSRDLVSQQIFSPLVSGFIAATISYLLIDWVFRSMVVPHVFPTGRLAEVPGSLAPGVRARLLLFLMAVAFCPLFTILGLVRAAADHFHAGRPAEEVVTALDRASAVTFFLYVALGIGLTLMLARSLTRPLGALAAALRRVQAGDLDVRVEVDASDEVGVLQDGANAMVAALREKERILTTFGRVVEPSVRDRLLSGDLGLGGEVRPASVLFCDLRGFTTMAEHASPAEVVATLNEFFSTMTSWVRECGGFVDKFIGDAMLVVFGLFDGDPALAQGKSAVAAIRCALGMRQRLANLNATRAAAGRQPLAIAIGAHTGEVLAGRIGAEDRHEYTVIGDTVNVAARLHELCRDGGRVLLVSETTYELARAAGLADDLPVCDAVSLRGRREPVRVFGMA